MRPGKALAAATAMAILAAAAGAQALRGAGALPDISLKGELAGIGLAWNNAGLCLLPILAWNAALTPKLNLGSFGGSVPGWYEAGENVLRGAAFVYPFLRPIDIGSSLFKPGLALYAIGTAMYFASWLPLMAERPAPWMRSLAVQLAPAYTPIIWLAGIALMANSPLELGISILFVAAHIGEYLLRWRA